MAVYDVFTPECLNDLFPIQRTNDFFDALFGDAEEGAYDIRLVVDPEESDDGELHFYFELHQRAGRCLVCSLTYGLPQFFFHVTTAYAILRHNGVEIGKRDYMGAF